MTKCNSRGRDCIEINSALTFNCSVTCEGVYSDVQWVDEPMEEEMEDGWKGEEAEMSFKGHIEEEALTQIYQRLNKKMLLMYADLEQKIRKRNEKKGKELDKEKFKKLITEYKHFKMKNVKHFRFNANATSSSFGKF